MKTSKQAETVAYDGTYYMVVKAQGRQWLVVDKFSGAIVDSTIRGNAVYLASALNTYKTRQEAR